MLSPKVVLVGYERRLVAPGTPYVYDRDFIGRFMTRGFIARFMTMVS